MSWLNLNESFANIKGQISNFTKEVLTVDDEEDEDSKDSPESRARMIMLEKLCEEQKNQIVLLQNLVDEFQTSKISSKPVNKNIGTQIDLCQEENTVLSHVKSADNITKKEEAFESESKLPNSPENEARNPIEKYEDETQKEVEKIIQTHCFEKSVQTDITDIDGDSVLLSQSFLQALKSESDLLRARTESAEKELSELRAQLHLAEELHLVLKKQIVSTLQNDFLLNGESTLELNSLNQRSSPIEIDSLILSYLNELAIQWRDVHEKKETLERNIAEFQISSELYSHHSLEHDARHYESRSSEEEVNDSFFPSKLDSYCLETILEEERSDDEEKKSVLKRTPSPLSTLFSYSNSCSSTQTEDEEPTRDRETINIGPKIEYVQTTNLEQASSYDKEQIESLNKKLEERDEEISLLKLDLERLRSYLIDLEEQHTGELLVSEERVKELQSHLDQIKTQLLLANQKNERGVEVQEEISILTGERNSLLLTNTNLEATIQKLNAQLQSLHFVLEQFQKEKSSELRCLETKLKSQIVELEGKNQVLELDLLKERELLEKAKFGLDAAHQLNAQIEEKNHLISQLKSQVEGKDKELSKIRVEIEENINSLSGKIDRYLVKNLLVGYFSTPSDKKNEVLRVLATVLDFNREDRQRTGLESSTHSFWPFSAKGVGEKDQHHESLSQAFIHFLEHESQPKANFKMSVAEVTKNNSKSIGAPSDVISVEKTVAKSFDVNLPAEGSRSSPTFHVPSNLEHSQSQPFTNEMSMSPVLTQADRSNSILKDILNPKP